MLLICSLLQACDLEQGVGIQSLLKSERHAGVEGRPAWSAECEGAFVSLPKDQPIHRSHSLMKLG